MKKNVWAMIFLSILIFNTSNGHSEESKLKFSGFIDTYYMYDFNRPNPPERQYTTQPVRHNEFNLNLAMVTAEIERKKTRGKLTLQHGNSVVKNYSGEPTEGSTSGPSDSRMIQEAYVGYKIKDDMWLDMGIYLGHVGMESWISRDNWTYTRSLMLDYVPYYQSGLRLSHKIDEKNSWQFHFINGWQIISENTPDKAVGVSYTHLFSNDLTFTYNNWLGNEKDSSNTYSSTRTYNNFILQKKFTPTFELKAAFDVGTQERQSRSGENVWTAFSAVGRLQVVENQYLALRVERFHDKDQAIVSTNSANGFKTWAGSINYDWHLEENAIARIEYRHFFSHDSIYPKKNGTSKQDSFIVASLGITF